LIGIGLTRKTLIIPASSRIHYKRTMWRYRLLPRQLSVRTILAIADIRLSGIKLLVGRTRAYRGCGIGIALLSFVSSSFYCPPVSPYAIRL